MLSEKKKKKMFSALQLTLLFAYLSVVAKGRKPTASCFFSYLKSGASSIGVVCDRQKKEVPCCQMLHACYLLPLILPVSELNNLQRTRHGCFRRLVFFFLFFFLFSFCCFGIPFGKWAWYLPGIICWCIAGNRMMRCRQPLCIFRERKLIASLTEDLSMHSTRNVSGILFHWHC